MRVLRVLYGSLRVAVGLLAAAVVRLSSDSAGQLRRHEPAGRTENGAERPPDEVFPSQAERAALLGPFVGPKWTGS